MKMPKAVKIYSGAKNLAYENLHRVRTIFCHVPDVNLSGEALKTYHDDVATCQRQIIQQYGDKYTANNAIIDVRQCLIKKGYVLIS
jgi:hypothetical protein